VEDEVTDHSRFPARIVHRVNGGKITVEKYHIYDDCRRGLMSPQESNPGYVVTHVGLSPELVDMFGLTPCSTCVKRFDQLTIAEILDQLPKGDGALLVALLDKHGYEITEKKAR
jgi:PHP family Zn ribbon phosphoesterase